MAEKNAIVVRLATALCPPDLPKSLHLAVHEHRLNTPMGMRHSKAIWSLIAVWTRTVFRRNCLAERSDIASRAFLRNSIELHAGPPRPRPARPSASYPQGRSRYARLPRSHPPANRSGICRCSIPDRRSRRYWTLTIAESAPVNKYEAGLDRDQRDLLRLAES